MDFANWDKSWDESKEDTLLFKLYVIVNVLTSMKNVITILHLVMCKLHNSTLLQLLIITSNQERTRGYWITQVHGKSSGMSVVIKNYNC